MIADEAPPKESLFATRKGLNRVSGYLPTMTSEDLMMAVTLSPAFKPRSSAASFVIEDVM